MALALLMETLDISIVNTSMPQIARDLQTSPITLKLAVTSYILSLALFIPISGWAAERFGSRKIFCGAIAVFTAGSALCGASQALFTLVCARLVQGMGGAMMLPVARLVLMRSYPRAELVRVTNLATIPSLIGPTLGPLAGGLITTYTSWRWIFLINVPIGLLGLLVAWRTVPDFRSPQAPSLDRRGFLLFGMGLACFSFAFEALGERIFSPRAQLCLWLLAAIHLLGYALHARRVPQPLLNFALVRERTFRLALWGSLISRLGIGGVPFLLALLLQVGRGLGPLAAGMQVVPISLGMLVTKLFVKRILHRFGFRRTLVLNTLALGLAISAFALLDAGSAAPQVMATAFVYGMLASLHFGCLNVLTYVAIAPRAMADATSMASTVQTFSMSFGVGAAALCIHAATDVLHWPLNTPAPYRLAFACLGLLTALSCMVFARLHHSDGAEVSGHRARRQQAGAAPLQAG